QNNNDNDDNNNNNNINSSSDEDEDSEGDQDPKHILSGHPTQAPSGASIPSRSPANDPPRHPLGETRDRSWRGNEVTDDAGVGESVFCAGQIALVPCTMELLRAGPGAQARAAFGHTGKVLEAVRGGLTLGHVLQAHCYVTRRRDVRAVRAVWEELLHAAAAAKQEAREEERGERMREGRKGVVLVVRAVVVVVVVVVFLGTSGLQRAAVELHAAAVVDDPAARTSRRQTAEVAGGRIESRASVSGDKQHAALSLSLVQTRPRSAPRPGPGAAGDLLEALGAALGDALGKMAADGLVPLCARLFYTHDHALANQIAAGLGECLRRSLDRSSPALALVPVLDLPDSQILHLSCWLSA
ncbi:hypothetical protein CRUP_009177, partial [Coryphaenoides rupestris]